MGFGPAASVAAEAVAVVAAAVAAEAVTVEATAAAAAVVVAVVVTVVVAVAGTVAGTAAAAVVVAAAAVLIGGSGGGGGGISRPVPSLRERSSESKGDGPDANEGGNMDGIRTGRGNGNRPCVGVVISGEMPAFCSRFVLFLSDGILSFHTLKASRCRSFT